MSDQAPRLLRSLLISMIGMLIVVGAAQAHGSRSVESGWLAGPEAATRSVVALPISQQTSTVDFDPCEEGEGEHAFGGSCCTVACHTFVADPGLVCCVSFRATSTDPLVNPLAPHGRAVGPGDRPPPSA